MHEDGKDIGSSPAFTSLWICVMVDHSEAMLFSALRQITEQHQFSVLSAEGKARCARHLAEMFAKEGE